MIPIIFSTDHNYIVPTGVAITSLLTNFPDEGYEINMLSSDNMIQEDKTDHGIGIVINGKTKIGSNYNVSQFLTIGSNKGTPATIGDNVYIGPGVCIVEDVKIGNNVRIGAGAVVVNDVPDNATCIGNPGRNILH